MTLWGQKNYWRKGKNYDEGYKAGMLQGHYEATNRMRTKIMTAQLRHHKRLTPTIVLKIIEDVAGEREKLKKQMSE